MHITYILYSTYLQKYYTGYTSGSISERLRKHNSNHSGFTGKTNDWQLIYQRGFEEKAAAMKLEKRIKQRGAKRFLSDLKLK